jgi:hypothetical protein
MSGIAAGFAECHADHPWSERRWRFVTSGLQAQTQHLWWGNMTQMANALRDARSVTWDADPHIDPILAQLQRLPGNPQALPAPPRPCLFAPVDQYCKSFSQWCRQTSIESPEV